MLPLSLASMAVDSLRCLDMWPAICTRAVKKRLAPQGCCPVGDMDCNQAPLPNGWSHHDWPAERTWCHPFSCPTSSMRTWRTRRSRRPRGVFYPRDIFSFRAFRYPIDTVDARSSVPLDKNKKSIDGFNLFSKICLSNFDHFPKNIGANKWIY